MNKKWTLANMPKLTGKTIIITGANNGLGFESAKVFAKNGALVVLTARTIEKAENAKVEILKNIPEANLDIFELDLMSLASIKSFAEKFRSKYYQIDILMNNAGIMMTPYRLSQDGFESQMATNHLGHFALTGLLIDLIIKTPESRIVNVSSLAHKQAKRNFNDLFFADKSNYSPMKAYAMSKIANLLFTYELQRLFDAKQIKTIAVAAHPGASHTNLGNHLVGKFFYKLLWPIAILMTQKPAVGALSQIRAAVDDTVKAGDYYGPAGFMQMGGPPVKVKSTKLSHNLEFAKILWDESEQATGISLKTLIAE